VNINRARLGKRFQAAEAIEGEKNSARLPRLDGAQAVAARSCIRSHFHVRGKTVTRRLHRRADGFGDFGWYRHNSNGLHDFDPHISSCIPSGNGLFSTRVIVQHVWTVLLSGFCRRTPKEWPGALQTGRQATYKSSRVLYIIERLMAVNSRLVKSRKPSRPEEERTQR
jgi:hypothetical protein